MEDHAVSVPVGFAGTDSVDVAANLASVRRELAAAAAEAGRPVEAVTLVAISKTHPAEVIRRALRLGLRVFGENRVQEAEDKWPALLREYPDLQLHLVGALQRNKVRRAVRLFHVIHSIDRPELARAIAEAAREQDRSPALLIQVNTGEEPQKAGVFPEDADALVALCRDELGLTVRGLMCIPPVDEEPSLHFALLREIAQRNGLRDLSMGMTSDFAVAVRFGATLVRIGTAIFGARPIDAPRAG